MRVAYLSSTRFGHRCLLEGVLAAENVEVVGILTTPRELTISYSADPVVIMTHHRFDEAAARIGCEVVEMRGKMNSDAYLPHLARWRADVILANGWYYKVPRRVREFAPLGCVGIHASLLPKYRGGAPIPMAIINGEPETGISFFHFEEDMDTGDIICQVRYPIDHDDTCATVYDKATQASIGVLREYLPMMAAGTAPRHQQAAATEPNNPQRKPADGLIDWRWPVRRIYNFVRGQTQPYPGAFTLLGTRRVTIWRAALSGARANGRPGSVVGRDLWEADALGVLCGDGMVLQVQQVGLEDGATLSGALFAAGPLGGAPMLGA